MTPPHLIVTPFQGSFATPRSATQGDALGWFVVAPSGQILSRARGSHIDRRVARARQSVGKVTIKAQKS
jgi:hypothetical protein